MPEQSILRRRRRRVNRRLGVAFPTLLVLAALASGCSGERPQLVAADDPSVTTSAGGQGAIPGATVPDPAMGPATDRADCATARGTTAYSLLATSPPPVACVAVAAHQRLEVVNPSAQPVEVVVGALVLTVEAGSAVVTEPLGTVLQPGLNPLTVAGAAGTGVWLADPSEQTLVAPTVALRSVGPIELGQTPAEVTAAVGGVPVEPSGEPCHQTGLQGDPSSPVLTFRGGVLDGIEVATPGATTPSGIGIGATEADILAAYGQRIESQPDPDGDGTRKLLVFVPEDEADQANRLVFVMEQDALVALRVGSAATVVTDPGCASS